MSVLVGNPLKKQSGSRKCSQQLSCLNHLKKTFHTDVLITPISNLQKKSVLIVDLWRHKAQNHQHFDWFSPFFFRETIYRSQCTQKQGAQSIHQKKLHTPKKMKNGMFTFLPTGYFSLLQAEYWALYKYKSLIHKHFCS